MSKRALLLVNRCARRGGENAETIQAALREGGLELLPELPCDDESMSDLIRRHGREADLIVLGGGDGTLNAAVDALAEVDRPLGIIPLGTANDLARTLQIPLDPLEACRVITDGQTKEIDLGQVNGKLFFNVASIGLSVAITDQLTADVKRIWGVLAYLQAAFKVIYRARPIRVEIRAEGQVHRARTVQITVGNGRYYGGGMTVSEDATIDDHLLDLYSLEIRHWWQIPLLFPRLRSGALAPSKYVRTLRGQYFEIITRRPHRVNTDGEVTASTPAKFTIVPKALSVFVPRPAA